MNPYRGLARRKQYKDGKFPGGRKSIGLTGRNYSIPLEYIKLFKAMNKLVGNNKLLRNEFVSSVSGFCDNLLSDWKLEGKRVRYKKGAVSTFMYNMLLPVIVKIRLLQTNPEKMELLFEYLEEHHEIVAKPKVSVPNRVRTKGVRIDDKC